MSGGGGLGDWLRQLPKRVQLLALPFTVSLLTCAAAYLCNQYTIACIGLAVCWTYRGFGRGLTQWKRLTGIGATEPVVWRQLSPSSSRPSPSFSRGQRSPSVSYLHMGTYQGKQEPPAKGTMGYGPREIKDQLARPNPGVPTPARRLSFREPPNSSCRTFLCPRKDYPLKQEQYSQPGSLPKVCLQGQQQKVLLTSRHLTRHTPVKISPLDPKKSLRIYAVQDPRASSVCNTVVEACESFSSNQTATEPSGESSYSPHTAQDSNTTSSSHHTPLNLCSTSSIHVTEPDPCATETVLKALRECLKRKRVNKDEDYEDVESKRRKETGQESKLMAEESSLINPDKEDQFETGFRPLLDLTNDAQWSTTFTPDKLREVQALKDDDWERSSSSFTSSETSLKRKIITVPGHNEITSSLSSSKHLLQKRKRTMETSRCDTPNSLIKMREDQVETAHLTPTEKKTMTTDEQTVEGTPSPNEPPRKRKGNLPWKRHVHLICPERPDEFYKLPPGPIPGYSVTQADYDAAKEAVRQRFLKLFEPSAQSAPSSALESSSLQTSLTSQALIVSGSSLLHTQGVSETQKTDTSGQNIPVSSYNFNSSFSDAKPSVVSSTTTPIFSTNATVTSTLPPSLASVQQKSESPKSSLLQILSKSEENTQSTVFKPIFEPRQSTNTPPNTSGLSSTTTATFMPIFGNSSIPETQSNTFKPILKDPCSQTVSSPFVFKSTNSTVSTLSLLSDKVNSTHANNPSKPNVIFSATTSNNTMTTSSGFAPIFGVDSQTKTVSSVGQDSTLKANTRFGVLNSTSTASVTNASLQQASTFRTATFATTSNPPTISNNTTGISGTSIQANIPTTTSFPNFGIQMGKNVFSAQNPFGNNQSKVATSVQSAAKTTSSFGITTSANLQSTAGNSGSALNTAIPFNSGPQSNNPTDSNLFNCVAQTGIGTPNKSTSFIFGNQKKVEDKNQPAFGQSTNTVPFQPMTPTQNFSSSTTAFTPIATAPGQSSAATSFLSMTPVQGFSVSSTTFTSTQQAVGPSPTSGQFPSVFPTPFNSAAASFSQNSNFFSHGIQPKPKPTARHKLHTRRPHQRKK